MKAALLVTGNIRTYELCAESFERLCLRHDPDIFICMSNREFDLHPYVKQSLQFYNDSMLRAEQIKAKFRPEFASRIKSLTVIDKNDEDAIITRDYLHLFDSKKDWNGIDIFKQFYKFNLAIEQIERYESQGKFKYDYVIKTRFDLDINIDTLPGALQNDTLYTATHSTQEKICDWIFVCHTINLLKTITRGVTDMFISNSGDASIYENIHTMLSHILSTTNIKSINSIECELNKNYNCVFDTTITLVTCFYNIGRDKWDVLSRPIDTYFANCEKVLKQRNPICIFTTDEYRERCLTIRRKTDPLLLYTKIIVLPFNELQYYDKRDLIEAAQTDISTKIPAQMGEPEFTQPDYILVICNRPYFFKHVALENPFCSKIFQWVDFGIHSNLLAENCSDNIFSSIFYKSDKIRIVGFNSNVNIEDRETYYNSHNKTLASTLMAGDKNSVCRLCDLFHDEFSTMLDLGLVNQEQYILYYLYCKNPEYFDYYVCSEWNSVGPTYLTKNTVRIALCMSGHMRTYDLCRDNIKEKIIVPLLNNGLHVDMFLSSWSEPDCETNIHDFTKYEFELQDSEFFLKNYYTDKWTQYSHLAGAATSGNAASMLYKMSLVYDIAIKHSLENNFRYDIIIRIRPDIKYHHSVDLNYIKECLLDKSVIYMPERDGRYALVTKCISDLFFFGSEQPMRHVMNTYKSIRMLFNEDCPHTCEGVIWKQIELHKIRLYRFLLSYGILRKDLTFVKM